jgi:serine phosphatase RsbU (regulator of sigma subunit)
MEIIGKINVVNGGKTIDKSKTKSPQPQKLKDFVFTIAKFIFLEKRDLQLYYNIMKRKTLFITLLTILSLLLALMIPYIILDSVYLLEGRHLPFLVTKQIATDSIGMFYKRENFRQILPLTYVKEINGIEVKTKKEFLELEKELRDKYEKVKIKFASPLFNEEKEYEVEVNFYTITPLDYTLSIIIPLTVGFIVLIVMFFLGLNLIMNIEHYTEHKIKKLVGSIILFTTMYLMIVTGLDLVLGSKFYPLLYLSFAFSGLAVSLFFYYSTYKQYNFQKYLNYINFTIGFTFVILYIIFFNKTPYLLTVVKLNYIYIFLSILLSFGYLIFNLIKLPNTIEKSRLNLMILLFTSAMVALGIIFFIQGLSVSSIPSSAVVLLLGVISPAVYFVITDHNLMTARRRSIFSILISALLFVVIYITSVFYQNLTSEGFIMIGIYLTPTTLFALMTVWYLEENLGLNLSRPSIQIEKSIKNFEKEAIKGLKRICTSIDDAKLLFQQTLVFSSENIFNLSIPSNDYQEILSTDGSVITLNDSIFLKKFQKLKKVFSNNKINYIIKAFDKEKKGIIALINSKRALSDTEITKIKLYLEVISIELLAMSTINTVKLTKVLNFEFEILRQSQINMLISKKEIRLHTPKGELVIRNFWEPISKIAGDIFGSYAAGDYITTWVSDICGKGLTAAALSFSCHSMISHILKDKINILETAKTVNEIMSSESIFYVDSFFITLSGATINLNTLEAELINCGNPPIFFSRGSEVTEINPKGSIIGVFDDQEIESKTIKLEKGDALLIFSDGITDIVKKENIIDGIDVLKNMLRNYHDPSIFWKSFVEYVKELKKIKDVIDDITVTFIYVE